MSKKLNKFVLLIVLISLIFFVIFLYQVYFWRFFVKDGQVLNLVLHDKLFSQGKPLLVEVVKNEDSIRRGLSNRTQLETTTGQKIDGMLFIFPEAKIQRFWMKDMQFAIDICWFNDQNLVNCTRQAQKPENGELEIKLPIYQSPQAADMILETMPDFLPDELFESRLFFSFFNSLFYP